jgi:hypothetical protein
LRWALVPFLLPLAVVLNGILARGRPFYAATLAAQIVFYAAAAAGWWRRGSRIGKLPFLYFPFYFCTANVAAIVGCLRLLSRRQSVLWKRTRP